MKHRDSRAPAPAQDWLPGLPFAGMGKDEKGLRESRLPRTPPPGPRAVSRGAREKPADRARAQMHLSLSTPLTRRVFPRPSSRRLLDGFSTSEEEDQAARPPPPCLLLPLPVSLLYTHSLPPYQALASLEGRMRTAVEFRLEKKRCARTHQALPQERGASG